MKLSKTERKKKNLPNKSYRAGHGLRDLDQRSDSIVEPAVCRFRRNWGSFCWRIETKTKTMSTINESNDNRWMTKNGKFVRWSFHFYTSTMKAEKDHNKTQPARVVRKQRVCESLKIWNFKRAPYKPRGAELLAVYEPWANKDCFGRGGRSCGSFAIL